jgi:hypothetical protein
VSETTLSLNQLLGLPEQGFANGLLRAAVSSADASALAGALAGIPWANVETLAHRKLMDELNDIKPMDLIAGAWQKYGLLADAARQSRSGEAVLVPLAEHSIASKLQPYIEIQLGPQVFPRIALDVTLTLKLKGMIVKVEAERIRSVEAGSCEGSAEVAFKNVSLWKQEIKPISVPGTLDLGNGIPIASA